MIINRSALETREPPVAVRIAAFAGSLILVAVVTIAGMQIASRWGSAPVVLLYLLPVLVSAVFAGLWPALFAAVGSTLAYNFYFTEPYRSFTIQRPEDIVTVIFLFVVAVVTSHLAASLRQQAKLAATHAARNATIAGFARRLLSCTSEQAIADLIVKDVASLFGCYTVLAGGKDEPQILASAPADIAARMLAPSDYAAAALTLNTGEPAGRGLRHAKLADWQFHPVAPAAEAVVALGLAREDGQQPVSEEQYLLFDNLLDQAALALERARLDREAREAATQRERDAIRSALLVSIGEDIKPRISAINSTVRSLRRAGLADKTLVSSLAGEATKLDRYVDNLVGLSPDAEQKPIDVGLLSVDLYQHTVRKAGVKIHLTPKEFALLAELAKHAGRVLTHRQLLRTVWGPAQEDQIDYLRVAVRSLRQKLEQTPSEPELIINEPAVGYRLALP